MQQYNVTADNLLLKCKRKFYRIEAYAQISTFVSPDKKADASACTKVVFLPTHPRIIVSLGFKICKD